MGGFLVVTEKSQVTVINSNFTGGFARFGSIITLFENYNLQSNIISCIFTNNSALNTLLDTTNSGLTIQDSLFENNSNILLAVDSSQINLLNNIIRNHYCDLKSAGCLINAQGNTIVMIDQAIVNNVTSLIGEGTIYIENAEIFINNSKFFNLKNQKLQGSCASIYRSFVRIDNCIFENYDQNCLFSTTQSNIFIFFSNFSQENFVFSSNSNSYGTIFCEDCLNFTIKSSSFGFNAKIQTGSSIYLTSTKTNLFFTSEIGLIENCTFFSNQANGDGTIYIFDQNVTIQNNIFQKNQALNGGALSFDNSDNIISKILIQENLFDSNFALISGGAIKWSNTLPIIENSNNFIGNVAIYAPNIAAYPIRLKLEIYNKTKFANSELNISSLLFDGLDNKTILLQNVSSGNDFPYAIIVKIIDFYGNVVVLDNAYNYKTCVFLTIIMI